MDQREAPLAKALTGMRDRNYVPFDVPGHKCSLSFLNDYFGEKCVALDFNSRKDIDYLCDPRGVILDAERLAADAFGAKDAFFMTGGTTSAVQAMVMSVCAPGDKIVLPRNVHYSVIYAVILSGAIPVYLNPFVHKSIGISLGPDLKDIETAIDSNSGVKAIFVNNPTYYGICSDLSSIVKVAHRKGIKVLVDEAHGTHFYFHNELPLGAMQCGADLSAISMHKTGGSLTQSSILLSSGNVPRDHIENTINLTRSTSASYLLMASLDLARRNLALNANGAMERIIAMCQKTRNAINGMGPYYAFSKDIIDGRYVYDFDVTKLSVNTAALGLAGIEVYTLLRDRYHIQVEFGDMCNFLAVSTIADTQDAHDRLVLALSDIAQREQGRAIRYSYEYITPDVVMTPREAFYGAKKTVKITDACNKISGVSIMCYPPGIPLLAPGERITSTIVDYIRYAAEKGCSVTGLLDGDSILVLSE